MLSYELPNKHEEILYMPFVYHYGDTEIVPKYEANWHSEIEILMITEGCGHFVCNDRDFVAKKGDIVVFNTDVVHNIYSNTKMKFLCYIIDSDFCISNGIPINEVYFKEHITDESLCVMFKEVIKEYGGHYQSKLPGARTRTALLMFMIALFESYTEKEKLSDINKKSHSYEYVRKAIRYIKLNIKEKLTVDDISSYVSISRFHFSKEFKRLTGMTIVEFINITRCNEAKLLITHGASVSEAATLCGFENLSYFSRTFKKYMGALPSDFRK
ncbi:MAG: helix-turn-helix transcriptional regulator [Clostridia bacterium]|nr:helix-turn-helix transcriptional regulator [Clostridia bacterium]